MSREEILAKRIVKFPEDEAGEMTDESIKRNVYAAMDELAEREAVGFGAFLCLSFYLNNNGFYRRDYQKEVYYDIQECYDLFILSKSTP